jgi:hypothetical protein
MTVAINPRLKQLQSVMQKFEERDQNRVEEKTPEASEEQKAPQKAVHLPYWSPENRGTPNAFLRGALFTATQGKDRKHYQRELIATLDGFEIRYTGIQLNQADLDLWETLLHLSRSNPLGEEAKHSGYGILQVLGKNTSKRDYESLKNSLARLGSAYVEVTQKGRRTYFGGLCGISGEINEETGEYRYKLNGGLHCLFDSGWSQVDYEQRKQLQKKPLALWLHGFYSSHAKPYPMKVETIYKLCGSETKDIKRFKQALKSAHEDLVNVGQLKSYEIESDLIRVKKTSSPSQVKHLKKHGEAQ